MHRIFYIFILLISYNSTHLSAQDVDNISYYPLSIGNQWDYSSQSFKRTEKIIDTTRINGNLYYGLSIWSDKVEYWMREERNILYLFNSDDSTEIILFDFNTDTGNVWELATRYNCSFGTEITLISKDDTIITPTDTFLNCYHFKHKQYCYDAGILDTWFSKRVGKVCWIEDNIFGSLQFELNSFTIISNIKTNKNILSAEYYKLYQNYPNPFNHRTVISYQLPLFSEVELSIFNILGQRVATLVSGKKPAGIYKLEWDASSFTSGVYFYKMQTDQGFTKTKKLVLLR